jgi:aspartate 1-decarboxylase
MLIRVCNAKIHRATVTEANLGYRGSITIDELLLEACGIRQYQMVNVNNLSNGVFWQTYVMRGERGSGVICLNGPPARHFQPGDKVIIIGEVYIDPAELMELKFRVVLVDDDFNKKFEIETNRPE